MKKLFQVTICVLLIATMLCACGGNFELEAEPVVREMMTALENGDAEAAMKLMHPESAKQIENMEKSIASMIEFVDGRNAVELKQKSFNITNRAGTSAGKYEDGTFRVVLDDETVLKIEYTYLKSNAGSGFTSFYLSIGS